MESASNSGLDLKASRFKHLGNMVLTKKVEFQPQLVQLSTWELENKKSENSQKFKDTHIVKII